MVQETRGYQPVYLLITVNVLRIRERFPERRSLAGSCKAVFSFFRWAAAIYNMRLTEVARTSLDGRAGYLMYSTEIYVKCVGKFGSILSLGFKHYLNSNNYCVMGDE